MQNSLRHANADHDGPGQVLTLDKGAHNPKSERNAATELALPVKETVLGRCWTFVDPIRTGMPTVSYR